MENILRSLDVLWKGMLAIFIVIGAVFLFVFLMNRLDNLNKKKRQDK
ncbi:MAG: sodium pump decarboxylase gamma subunit [Clostridiales bacterium]|jgi:preprotein translocase subunit YajC|nr:sodium pump decarboxylase gamma subunit [Clostridiales bacterium]